ncbi:iron ABC transporter permease [Tumebacillus sp. DT12]|uniref:Iron ABC transporter permease n=1 Tax=Tumebacillus lacus TaxID=2995335 RepID=A0ABT3X5N7_9BACL|nr:iron ABC transporter permease [Tumebacillus lacus]MCX7571268.1 iron ABC transporter permease [Tumebacillus lacus]
MKVLFSNSWSKSLGLLVALLLVIASILSSIVFGVLDTTWQTAIDAYTNFSGTNEEIVIRDVRVPRALIAAVVGASLGLSGVLMQVLTRNPLADPGIFGINAGASFAVVAAVNLFSISSLTAFTWIAFAGAALSGVVVYVLGSLGRNGLTPVSITLAGAAITALCSSFTNGLMLLNERALEEVLFWLAGSVSGRSLEMLWTVLPYALIGWVGAVILARPLQTLQLGEDVAKGLGQKTWLVKIATGVVIILLAGSAVAVAGPIAFVGLVIPHLVRPLVGNDLRWTMLFSAALGAILLLTADIGARFIAEPKEMPLGVMTALIGTPFFVYVARKGISRK